MTSTLRVAGRWAGNRTQLDSRFRSGYTVSTLYDHPEAENSIDLAVAGLGMVVHSRHDALIRALCSRYRPWLTPVPAQCRVTVRCGTGERPRSRPSPLASFDAEQNCHVTAPGYHGLIDASVSRAVLDLVAPSADDVDYFLRGVLALLAFRQGGLLIHAAGLLRAGRAFLFSGRSGAGKSTTTRVSLDLPGVAALSDDLVLLMPGPDGWLAQGTPFWNPETPQALRTGQTACGPLAGLFRLVQDKAVFARPLGPAEAVAGLLSDLPIVPVDARRVPALLSRLNNLVAATPVAELHFRPEPSLWSAVDAFLQETPQR